MTRHKRANTKWTLVIVLFVLCQTVLSRPQNDTSSVLSSTQPSAGDGSSENPIRYNFRSNFNISTFVSPLAISFSNPNLDVNLRNQKISNVNEYISHLKNPSIFQIFNETKNTSHRRSRLIRGNNINEFQNYRNNKTNGEGRAYTSISKLKFSEQNVLKGDSFIEKNKPVIRKVITKWTDQTKYEDLKFDKENSESDNGKIVDNSKDSDYYTSNENNSEISGFSKDNHPKLTKKVYYKPRPQYSEHPINPTVQYTDYNPYSHTRPYTFTTPSPTPIITNVGYPPPWPQQNYQVMLPVTTTQRPTRVTNPIKDHYNYQSHVNNYPQYPANNYEVTTFQPTSAYTDRIIIRPEEYSASPDECPTIYLTLNNTFQGQAKEACPDLNIAVNTNVVNKNNVIESEEDTETSFADVFGIPSMDDSESGDSNNDYNESAASDENTESASIEGTALTNYNANAQESAEPGNFASPSSALSTITKPGRPSDNDDDVFGFSSIVDFFRPALRAFNWLATISPLGFGIISFILTPIAILFAGFSGLAALFAPLSLTYAREAPKLLIQPPHWYGDNSYMSVQDLTMPNKRWYSLHGTDKESNDKSDTSIKPTLFYRMKEWMRNLTAKLGNNKRSFTTNSRKSKRRKREVWTSTVK